MGLKAVYVRVSSQEQAEGTHALEQQLARVKAEKPDVIFQDVESGKSKSREQFQKMMEGVKNKKISTIIATRWDRLTRSHGVYLDIKKVLHDYDVKLILLDQGEVDLCSAAGELAADMSVMLAIHESRMLGERIQRGHRHRRNRGAPGGRAPYGYRIVDEKYTLDNEPVVCLLEKRPENYKKLAEAPDDFVKSIGQGRSDFCRDLIEIFLQVRRPRQACRLVYEKYGFRVDGKPLFWIPPELKFWSRSKDFKNWVLNPVLRGHTVYPKYKPPEGADLEENEPEEDEGEGEIKKKKKIIWKHKNTHPEERLLSEDEYIEIQNIFQANSRKIGSTSAAFYLTGLIHCGTCGYKCVLKNNKDLRYYGCRNSTTHCTNRKCVRIESINGAIINKIFTTALEAYTSPRDDDVAESAMESPKVQALRKKLVSLESLLAEHPDESGFKQLHREKTQELEEMLATGALGAHVAATAQHMIRLPQARNLTFWHTLTEAERERLFEPLLRRITISDGEVTSVELKVSDENLVDSTISGRER